MTETVLIAAAIGVPVAALLLASAFESARRVADVASLSIVILLLCGWLIDASPGRVTVVSLLSTSWLHVAGVPPIDIGGQLSVQPTSVVLVILALLALWVSVHFGRSRAASSQSPPSDVLLRQLLLTSGAFSSDLVVILMSWLVTDAVIDWQRARVNSESPSALPPLRLTSLLLLVAVVVMSARYHTTDVATLLEAMRADERIDAVAVRGGLAICMAAAIAFRCGQFPAVLWVKRLTAGSSQIGVSHLLTIIVPAFVLAVRLSPLWPLAPEAGSLFATLGALTSVTMGLTACSTKRFNELPPIVCVMLCGQALICCGSPFPQAAVSAGVSLLIGLVGLSFLEGRLSRLSNYGQGVALMATLWGPASLAAAMPMSGTEPSPDAGPELTVVWAAMMLGQLLLCFAFVRACWADRDSDDSTESSIADRQWASRVGYLFVCATIACVLWATGNGRRIAANTTPATIPTPSSGIEILLAGLLGVVPALLLFERFVPLRQSLAQRFDSLLRVAREWWFAEELAQFLIVRPLRVVAIVIEFIDRRLLGGGRDDAWIEPGTRFAHLIDSVRVAEPKFYAIAIAWAVAGLIVAMTFGLR